MNDVQDGNPFEALPTKAAESRHFGATYHFNGVTCLNGHKAPRSNSNGECIVCRNLRGQAKKRGVKFSDFVADNPDLNEATYKRYLDNANQIVADQLKLMAKNVPDEKTPDETPQTPQDATPPDDAPQTPQDDETPEKTETEAPDAHYTSRAWVAAFIARQKPTHFTIREAFNWVFHTQKQSATYGGVSQAIGSYFNQHKALVEIAAFGRSKQFKALPKFFFLHEKEIKQFCEMVPADADLIKENALVAFKTLREETNDEEIFDRLDEIIEEMEGTEKKLKEEFALELTGDEARIDEDILDDTADLALIGRSILHYVLELQSGTATEAVLRKMDNLKIDNTSLRNRVHTLEGSIKRLSSIIKQNNETIKEKEHTIYQLKVRLDKIRIGIDERKTPESKVKLGDVARISKTLKNPSVIIRRPGNGQTPSDENEE